MTVRFRSVGELDLTAPRDLDRLRELLSSEYATLAARKDQLLRDSPGKYVLIHGSQVDVYPSIEDAYREGYRRHPDDLFVVAPVLEQDIRRYLAS